MNAGQRNRRASRFASALAVGCIALLAGPAQAIIMRDDVADARYRELGEKYRPAGGGRKQ